MRRAVSRFMPKARPSKLPSDVGSGSYRLDHGSVDEFYIALDDPHKSWSPGEEISGQVILRSKKNLANIAIKFNLAGYVKIHASPHSKLRPMKTVLFSHTIQIYGPHASAGVSGDPAPDFTNGLYKGEHRFPFIVKLPNKRVFTSIDFGKGAITYVLSTHLVSADVAFPQSPSSSSPSSFGVENSGGSPRMSLGFNVSASDATGTGETFSLAKARETLSKLHNPTYSYEKIINLVNPVDVAFLPAPKRKRLIIKNPRKGKLSRVQSSTSTVNTFGTAYSVNSDAESAAPAPQTQPSSVVHNSPSLELQRAVSGESHQSSPPGTPSASVQVARPVDTIRVSMDMAQRGYLRGELIPIKLSINHLRQIQDSSGIIVTLVRVCRIDYGPDGYYESFRKDLQQHVIPLFVDPVTFSSEISTSVRVPPDAFPTISGCPLVTFQYFIEVMLNLSGKSLSLATPNEQPKSSVSRTDESPGPSQGLSPQAPAVSYNFHSLAHSRSEYINTDKFKRSKKFLQMTTEVVIGTHRSVRPAESTRGSTASISDTNMSPNSHSYAASRSQSLSGSHSQAQSPSGVGSASNGLSGPINAVPELFPMDHFDSPPYLASPILPEAGSPGRSNSVGAEQNVPRYTDVAVSPSHIEQPVLSEKERMRQHEASLLPSAPPLDEEDDQDEDVDEEDDEINNGGNSMPTEPSDQVDPLDESGLDWSMGLATAGQSADEFGAGHDFMSDDLYQASGSTEMPDIHEGIGSEGTRDYVPNYNAAANDRLVESNQEMN